MMYKLLPVVTAVAAERFLAAPAAFPGGQGEGYDITNNKIKSTAHGYVATNEMYYLLNGGTAQTGLADKTKYAVKTGPGTNDFQLDGVTLAATASQTEPATWVPCVSVAANANAACTSIDANDGTTAASNAIATYAANTDTVFTTTANANLTADSLVMYACKMDGTTEKCLAGMTNMSTWTVAAASEVAGFKLKAASGTGNLRLAETQANKANATSCPAFHDGSCHSFIPVGTAWKSVTTAAPSAAASNFNVMVATVASGFLYLLM